jgi:NAD(P)-dependent dehydrogenase (short-subunit alcohol dehydrogenase family)
MPVPPLASQVALVTGASRGLGRAMALRLAGDGCAVALAARSPELLAEVADAIGAAGGRAVALPADVTDPAQVDALVDAAEAALGPLTLLVNNAGHGGVPGPVWAIDPERWWETFAVNLRGPFLCTRAALARMVPRGHGRIVNVSSRAGNAAIAHASAYATSKAALTRLTEIVATELRPHGLAAFAIDPGQVRTAMTETLMTSEAGRTWLPWYRDTFDAGQDASPDDAAALVAALATGVADALSGRLLTRLDDLAALAADAEAIARDERRVLRLRP